LKKASILLAVAGVAVGIFLAIWLGAAKVFQAVLSVGWPGFATVVGWPLVVIGVLAAAWQLICPGASLIGVTWGRLVREGGCNILPLSEFGGLAFGARVLALSGVPGPRAIASSIADVAAEQPSSSARSPSCCSPLPWFWSANRTHQSPCRLLSASVCSSPVPPR
jgi:hypothetical protein